MDINWFPGHMAKSLRLIEENLKLIDVVIYVLDARAPASCINPTFNELIRAKPIVYILNKADLAPRGLVDAWVSKLSTERSLAVAINALTKNSTKTVADFAVKICKNKIEKYAAKGAKTSVKAMVIGVPNTGKSTVINNLAKTNATVTGNKAGVTRGKQWVRVNDYFDVLDTPGTLYPKLIDQSKAKRLAFIGSIKDEVVDTFELCLELIKDIDAIDSKFISERYKVETYENKQDTVAAVAKARGYLLKGGEPDTERTVTAIVDDFRKGRMGQIILEKAEDFIF